MRDIDHPNLEKIFSRTEPKPVRKKVEPMKETEPQTEPETEPEPEIEIIFEEDKFEHLKRFCVYSVMFYIPYF